MALAKAKEITSDINADSPKKTNRARARGQRSPKDASALERMRSTADKAETSPGEFKLAVQCGPDWRTFTPMELLQCKKMATTNLFGAFCHWRPHAGKNAIAFDKAVEACRADMHGNQSGNGKGPKIVNQLGKACQFI